MKKYLLRFIRKINGLRQKLFSILLATSFFTLLVGFLGVSSIQGLFLQTQIITEEELPRVSAVHEIVIQIITADKAFDNILATENFSDMTDLQENEADFRRATFRFDMFLAALVWGSESQEFIEASDGLLYAEWKREGLKEKLVIKKANEELIDLALQTGEAFEFFTESAQKSISDKKKSLRLFETGKFEESESARVSAWVHKFDANNFFDEVNNSLNNVVGNSESVVAATVADVHFFQQQQYFTIVTITLASFVLSILLGILFSSRVIMNPIVEMMQVVKNISSGDLSKRVIVRSHDEIGDLANSFNDMTEKLEELYSDLEVKVEERTEEINLVNKDLKRKIEELEKFQNLTVDRELKMVSLKKEIREIKESQKKT